MINKDYVCKLGLEFIDEYSFDDTHHSFVFKHNNICVIVDDNICENNKEIVFDYSKYCEMQNKYMATFDKLYRFNYVGDSTYTKINEWLNKTPNDIEIKDVGGSFDIAHTDNTPLEKTFEDLFVESYGDNATEYLKKEYAVSLNNGRNAFIDYVVETKQIDISQTLPFEGKTFDLIIVDLSLHYFDEQTTKKIMQEIKRILRPSGNLLARVNSTADINHGAGQGEKLEENFYFVEGYNKRFFSMEDAQKFFSTIGKAKVREADMLRYTKPKKVIEVNVEREL